MISRRSIRRLALLLFAISIQYIARDFFTSEPQRRQLSNCKWDIRKGATVCHKADGSIWVGPANDATATIKPVVSSSPSVSSSLIQSTTSKIKKWDVPWKAMLVTSSTKKNVAVRSGSSSKNRANYRKNMGDAITCGKKPEIPRHDTSSGFVGTGKKAAQRIILFVVDDLQPDGVSSFSVRPRPSSQRKAYQFLHTPNLDALATGGAIFARAYTPHPLCSPSRYAIMTGRYASRSRRAVDMAMHRDGQSYGEGSGPPLAHLTLNGNAWVIRGTRTLAHVFQESGFATAATGKWHLSSTVETGSFTYQDAANSAQPYAKEVPEVKAAGFDDVFALFPINMRDAGFSWFSHNPEWMAVESFDWLDRQRRKASSASKDGRSFLYFAFTLPHMPKSSDALSHAPSRLPDPHSSVGSTGLTPPDRDKLRRMSEMRDRSRKHIMNMKAVATHNAGGQNWASGGIDKAHHVPGLLWIDAIIGEFTNYLRSHNELDDTVMLFTADHGCIAKGHCFEPSMRIPMFVHCPKLVKKGTIVDHVVANIDIAPTLLDFAGIDASGGNINGIKGHGGSGLAGVPDRIIDGRSLASLVAPSHKSFEPSKAPHPDGIFCEIYSDRSVVTRDYALVDLSRSHYLSPPYDRKPWGDRLQLYRVVDDIEMRSNLVTKVMAATDPIAGHAMKKLQVTLTQHIQDVAPACQRSFYPDMFPTKFVQIVSKKEK